jgi:hypothetical protein
MYKNNGNTHHILSVICLRKECLPTSDIKLDCTIQITR